MKNIKLENIGKFIRKERKDRGWGLYNLMRISGVHENTIMRIEKGKDTTLGTLSKILSAFDYELEIKFKNGK